VLRLHIIHIDL